MISDMSFAPIRRDEGGNVVMLDQRLLPREEVWNTYATPSEVAGAIRSMVIRGAPAIGIAAAMGLAMGARHLSERGFRASFDAICEAMATARPTAVNLFWAIARMKRLVAGFEGSFAALLDALDAEAAAIQREDIAMNRAMGAHGAALIPDGARVLTHCNTGALATGGYGTALGVIRAAQEAGKKISVYADETRPWLQGARLTAWELMRDDIPVTIICDNAAGSLMARGEIDLAIVGSDRIAANGDVANKIGTYQVAVLCAHHGLPFYVAAPTSTIALETASGADIPIEERGAEEVVTVFGTPIAPEGAEARNPAFDVTPAALIAGIVTEQGVARAPYGEAIEAMVRAAESR